MKLLLRTFKTSHKSTIGTLSVDGEAECFTLEDTYRETKVDGETRIPRGTYNIKLRTEGGMNRKYQKKFGNAHHGMLWLQDVPGFEWIYIHYGNYSHNTEGCILVGSSAFLNKNFIGSSVNAYKELYAKVIQAIANDEEITIEII